MKTIFKGLRFGMLLQIAIGPVCIFILQTAITRGFLEAELGVLGVVLVDALYITAATLGIGVLFDKYKKAENILKYFGAIVLIVFGISNIIGAIGISFLPSFNLYRGYTKNNVFFSVLLLTLSNPLTMLFWAGVFSTKLIEEKMCKKDIYGFGFGAILSTMIFLTGISLMGSVINTFIPGIFIEILNVAVGILLVLFGLKMLYKNTKQKVF